MKRLLICGVALLAALIISQRMAIASPQTGSGVLSGVVIGPDDKPVANAVITYQSGGGNAPHVVHADAHGRFTISKLHNDSYDLRASGSGVFSEWERNITVRSGKVKTLTLHLIYAKEIPKAYVASHTYEQN